MVPGSIFLIDPVVADTRRSTTTSTTYSTAETFMMIQSAARLVPVLLYSSTVPGRYQVPGTFRQLRRSLWQSNIC